MKIYKIFLKRSFFITLFLTVIISFIFFIPNNEKTSICKTDRISDIEGNTYEIIDIGERCWMAENLKTTRFSDGSKIPKPISNESWREAGNKNKGAYACYDNSKENCDIYGALYNIYAVNKGICPKGWYVPTDDDWKEFEREMGISEEEIDLIYWRGENIATKIAGEAELWKDKNIGERRNFNEYGFRAVPGGYRLSSGIYSWIGHRANFWSSTLDVSGWRRTIIPGSSEGIRRTAAAKNMGFSVRCIQK